MPTPRVVQVPKDCATCGEPFTPRGSAKARYCGALCKGRAQRPSPSVRRERGRAYSKSERYRFNQRNAKARRRAVEREGGLSHAEWLAIVAEFGGRCAYCRELRPLTMDHVEPLSKGGRHVVSNIVPACQPCNSAKCDRDWTGRLACRSEKKT